VVVADLGHPGGRGDGTVSSGGRWPQWVYGGGDEPDHRFSLANERTFLAWIRTSLALLAGGVALDTVELDTEPWLQTTLALVLVLLGLACGVASWLRWARTERAMRRLEPLPSTAPLAWFALVMVLVAAGLVVLLL
jgi:putative membrane protein